MKEGVDATSVCTLVSAAIRTSGARLLYRGLEESDAPSKLGGETKKLSRC